MISIRRRKTLLALQIAIAFVLVNTQVAEAAYYRISIRITITMNVKFKPKYGSSGSSTTSLPKPKIMTTKVTPGEIGSSSALISWENPSGINPKGGYRIDLWEYGFQDLLQRSTSNSYSNRGWKVEKEKTQVLLSDLRPNLLYGVVVTSFDDENEYGSIVVDELPQNYFCAPANKDSDARCWGKQALIRAQAGATSTTEVSNEPVTESASFNYPTSAPKFASIEVSWPSIQNSGGFIVQAFGPSNHYAETRAPSTATSAVISGLHGSSEYVLRVLALGQDGQYTRSENVISTSSPGIPAIQPQLMAYARSRCGQTGFVMIDVRSRLWDRFVNDTRNSYEREADAKLSKAYIVRFRKVGDANWLNVSALTIKNDPCNSTLPSINVYPNKNSGYEYKLPDEKATYEFQAAEVMNSQGGGGVVGDWSSSDWVGPDSQKLRDSTWSRPEDPNDPQIKLINKVREWETQVRIQQDAQSKAEAEAEAKARAEAEAEVKPKSKTAKITKITCQKGGLRKTIKGVNPRCPRGFVKRQAS